MKYFSIIFFISTCAFAEYSSLWQQFFPQPTVSERPKNRASLMFVPSGNSTLPGRKVKNNFEYTLAHQIIKAIAQEISTQFPTIRIHTSNAANQQLEPLQLATMSNCLQVSLVLMIQFYYEHDMQSHTYIYRCSYGQEFIARRWDLSWCPIDQAHLINKNKSRLWATKLINGLSCEKYKPWFSVEGPFKLPLKPLIGIIAPALLIEIGLKDDVEWTQYVEPLVASLKPILQEITAESDEEPA